jgi:hypothetical protein
MEGAPSAPSFWLIVLDMMVGGGPELCRLLFGSTRMLLRVTSVVVAPGHQSICRLTLRPAADPSN